MLLQCSEARHRSLARVVSISFCLAAVGCDAPPDPRRTNFRVERGNVAAQYDDKTGRLKKLEVDTDKNGKTDTLDVHGRHPNRPHRDRPRRERKSRPVEYYADKKLEKVGTSTRGDGVVDEWAFQGTDGVLARVETDTDRDGRIDKWESFDPPRVPGGPAILRAVAIDPDDAGQPRRRLLYAPGRQFRGDRTARP